MLGLLGKLDFYVKKKVFLSGSVLVSALSATQMPQQRSAPSEQRYPPRYLRCSRFFSGAAAGGVEGLVRTATTARRAPPLLTWRC